jgi:hypothetical protein
MKAFLEDRPLGRTLAGALMLLVGLVFLTIVVYYLAQDVSLWFLGRRTVGEVLTLGVERTSENTEGELTFKYWVKYRFTTPGGQVIIDTSTADVREWAALAEGGPVAIVYFPLYPAHNRLDESRFISVLACAYLPLLLVTWASLGVGWYLLQPGRSRSWWFGRDKTQSPG